jgi:hypothetical protein
VNTETQGLQQQDERRPPWSARRPSRAAFVYGLTYLMAAVAGGLIAGRLSSPLLAGVWVTLVSAATLAFSLLLVLCLCRLPLRPAAEAGWMLAAIALFLLVRPQVFAIIGPRLGAAAFGRRLAEMLYIVPGQELFGNIALILFAVFLGRLVSRVIREGKLLLPVAVVASLVDIFTVFWGVVAEMTEKAPEVVTAFSASAPVPAPAGVAAPILSSIGIGDFLFLSLFLAVALRSAMNAPRTMWAAFAVMLIAPFAFFIWPQAPGMPGLPFLSVAVLAVNWRHLRFTREEKRALAFAALLVAAVALTVWTILRQ